MMMNLIKVAGCNDPQLFLFTKLKENQLARLYEPDLGLFIAESPNVVERALNAGYEPVAALMEEGHEIKYASVVNRFGDIPIYQASYEDLINLTGYELARGMFVAMRRRNYPSLAEVCKEARRIAVLEHVVNPTNIGAIFRSAAALGMDAVVLTSDCSDPLYRRSARVSMGTVFQIPWTYVDEKQWLASGNDMLHELGFKTMTMALKEDSLDIDAPELMECEKLAIILGSEGYGLDDATINSCDYRVCIPMAHGVDSLNVACASAIAFWQLGKGNRDDM